MPEATAQLSLGMPVEIGRIDKELKKLWESDGGTATRASLINFAIYCEGAESMAENTALIAEFTTDHACRAILIATEPQAPEQRVQAWISAHCHITRAGAKQVCCEQISFLLEGNSRDLIPNIVFSHLDSDLPLYLWWRGEFSEKLDAQLWAWVNRLIFDSQKWDDVKGQFTRLRDSLAVLKPRLILCDLNWTRLLHLRWALAQMFDHPANLLELRKVLAVELAHAAGYRATAVLLLGWLMAQLNWRLVEQRAAGIILESETGRFEVRFAEQAGADIGLCMLRAEQMTFRITRDADSEFFHSEVEFADGRRVAHLVPAGKETLLALLNEELMRGGRHQVYLRALAAAEPLF